MLFGVPFEISATQFPRARKDVRNSGAMKPPVDSELACLPQMAPGYVSQATPQSLYSTTTNAAVLHPTNGILLVASARILTTTIAARLVEKSCPGGRRGCGARHTSTCVTSLHDPVTQDRRRLDSQRFPNRATTGF